MMLAILSLCLVKSPLVVIGLVYDLSVHANLLDVGMVAPVLPCAVVVGKIFVGRHLEIGVYDCVNHGYVQCGSWSSKMSLSDMGAFAMYLPIRIAAIKKAIIPTYSIVSDFIGQI